MSKKVLNNNKNEVLQDLLEKACNRFETDAECVRADYSPRRPPANKVINARGYFVALVRSFGVPLVDAAKFLELTSTSAYNSQVTYLTRFGNVTSADALKALKH